MLTDAQLRKVRPAAKGFKLPDGDGLHLWVAPTGTRTWRWRYERGGKERLVTLGTYPRMGLAQARARRDALRDEIEGTGGAQPVTLRQAGADWMRRQTPLWKPSHAEDVRRSLEAELYPELGEQMLGAITTPRLLGVLTAVQHRGAIELAHRLRQRVEGIYLDAIAAGRAVSNPAAGLARALAPVVRQGRRPAVLDIERARAVLQAVEATAAHPVILLAHRLLALTALRPGELRGGEWREIEDLEGAAPLWRVPAPRMKQKRVDAAATPDHLVPLAPAAVDALRALARMTGHGALLFPQWTRPRVPISENALVYLLNRAGLAGRQVPHGWRATFSSVMNERRPADARAIDLMLAHKPQGVEAAYNRAQHMDRRREIAGEWAELLMQGARPAESLLDAPRALAAKRG